MLAVKFLIIICAIEAKAHPDGAPLESCETMTPDHPPYKTQNSPSPYVLTVSHKVVSVGEDVILALSSPNGNEFKGFLIKAVPTAVNTGVAGKFTNNFSNAHYLDCNDINQSAVTHSDPSNKTSITLIWKTDTAGVFNFRATVAESYTPFWVGISSESITVQ